MNFTFNEKEFRFRALSKFIKRVLKAQSEGKLDSFCRLYNLDYEEISYFFCLLQKYGDRALINEIVSDESLVNKILSVMQRDRALE